MSGTNGFVPFAYGSGANVLSDSAYQSAIATGGTFVNGVVQGQASSQQANKSWRQGTLMAAVLGQIIADYGQDANDSQTVAVLEANLLAAIRNGYVPYSAYTSATQSTPTGILTYRRSPDGFIRQTGTSITPNPTGVQNPTNYTVTFPIPFASRITGYGVSVLDNDTPLGVGCSIGQINGLSSMLIRCSHQLSLTWWIEGF